MIIVQWEGPNGVQWHLEGDPDSLGGVILGKPAGLKAAPERSTTGRPTGVGVRIGGRTYPAMTGSLHVGIRGHGHQVLGEVYDQWAESWSTDHPGELIVIDGKAYRWHTAGLLDGELPDLNLSPWNPALRFLEMTVPVFAPDGVWEGEKIVTTGAGAHQLRNRGSIEAYPDVVWDGAGCQVTTPTGLVVDLPSVSAPRVLSTDPGTGFTVTDRAGNVDPDTWAAFRGLPVRGHIGAGQTQTWRTNSPAVSLELTPRCENPWR